MMYPCSPSTCSLLDSKPSVNPNVRVVALLFASGIIAVLDLDLDFQSTTRLDMFRTSQYRYIGKFQPEAYFEVYKM